MDIREKVLEIRAGRNFVEFQKYFKEHPSEYKKLIELINSKEAYPIPEYASWILVHLCKSDAPKVQSFYKTIVNELFVITNQSVRRNLINVIDHLVLTDYIESELIDELIKFIQDYDNKVAVHIYSMQVLTKFVKKYPELKVEIGEIIELNSENKSPAYGAGMRKFQRKTKNI